MLPGYGADHLGNRGVIEERHLVWTVRLSFFKEILGFQDSRNVSDSILYLRIIFKCKKITDVGRVRWKVRMRFDLTTFAFRSIYLVRGDICRT